MEGLPLSVEKLSCELSVFGVGQTAVRTLKGRQLCTNTCFVNVKLSLNR